MSQNFQSIISFIAVKSDSVSSIQTERSFVYSLFVSSSGCILTISSLCVMKQTEFFFSTASYTLISCFHCDYFSAIIFFLHFLWKTGHPSSPHDTDNLLSFSFSFVLFDFVVPNLVRKQIVNERKE